MLQSTRLVKLEVLFRKKGSWLYLKKKKKKSQNTINLIKAFCEDNQFSEQLNKCLEKKILLVFPAIPTNKNN